MANASPALTGLPALYGADVYSQDTAKKFPMGAAAYAFGGTKMFRYGRNNASTAAVAGNLQVAPTIEANHANVAVASAAAVDAYTVSVTLGATAAAKDLYAEGEMVVNDEAGEGISYRILGNDAIDSSGTGNVYLVEPIQVALTTSSEVSLIKNPYDRFVISVTDQGDQPVGVANKAMAVDLYGWIQTGGMASVLADETIAVGSAVVAGSSVAGSVETMDTDDVFAQVGIANQAGVDTEHRAIYLTLF